MIELKEIKKNYYTGGEKVEALKGVNVAFRDNEFVSILGHSGCGKTTLLNIIGGLDRFSGGDLIINGKSTKKFTDRDWDTYRNHTIGFVFQSYNLIPHQSVLANVELALTISGVSKAERRKRAIEALEKVGLGDQLKKKPNQMSGGQMQRVAIARSLVNDPDILLADEPTGALDSETSVQIMKILKEISKDRLIIMVTHNPDLAKQYSSRIVSLKDGLVTDDTNPYIVSDELKQPEPDKKSKQKKPTMSFLTALSLSFNNLRSKKARTILTSFAGSIGIIGISLILSLSTGVKAYITSMEEQALSQYPMTIMSDSMDIMSMMTSMMDVTTKAASGSNVTEEERAQRDSSKVYSNTITVDILNILSTQIAKNDLKSFKTFLDNSAAAQSLSSGITYDYNIEMKIFENNTSTPERVNPNPLLDEIGVSSLTNSSNAMNINYNVFQEISSDTNMLNAQYDIVGGRMAENYNEAVLVLDANGEISDYTLYSLGIKDKDEFRDMVKQVTDNEKLKSLKEVKEYDCSEFIGKTYKVIPNSNMFEKKGEIWVDKSDDNSFLKKQIENGIEIKVVGVVKPASVTATSNNMISGFIGYRSDLAKHIIDINNKSKIVKEQTANPKKNVFSGTGFPSKTSQNIIIQAFTNAGLNAMDTSGGVDYASMLGGSSLGSMDNEELGAMINRFINSDATYDDNMNQMGCADLDTPSMIYIYPKDFEAKSKLDDLIVDYNNTVTQQGHKERCISYSDAVGAMMESVVRIVNIISWVLIAFVAVSLIVSSIMISIITYISVIERTKEIGILRSIGASKHNISNVFNAETFLIGLSAGVIGVAVTLILDTIINVIALKAIDIQNIAHLNAFGIVGMIVLSVILTLIAGLIPSSMAAKKDPVEALRTE